MSRVLQAVTTTLLLVLLGCTGSGDGSDDAADRDASDQATLKERAGALAQKTLLIDTHVDVPYRLQEKMEDISQRTEGGNFDYDRAKEGGLDAPFMSIYIPASYQEAGGAKQLADELIDMVEGFEKKWPAKFEVARSVADVRRIFESGKIALPMGMENGAPIEGDLDNLSHFHQRGIRYITLTHSRVNHICDSSYDKTRKWNGLSPFGRKVVAEMNRLGIMIDVSHISDDTFHQVIELTQAPVIASHSSCRHFTPGWERNMSDEMIEKVGRNGGVVQINFGSSFISGDYRTSSEERQKEIDRLLAEKGWEADSDEGRKWIADYRKEHPLKFADVSQVADHIDHIRDLIGIDHIGIGSDFDGVGDSLPTGLKDVSQYHNLFAELLRRDYSEEDIEKIASGNTLRVWSAVESFASQAQTGGD